MIQEIIDLLPDAVNRIHAPIALAIAGVGLLIALVGEISRSVIALSLVSAGTVIGIHMPKWFGWGIDPMGTAFGMAIVLGISGYVLTTMWEGILFAALLAGGAGMAAWMNLASHQAWHLPAIDWSQTALEIASKIRLSLPTALTTVLPVVLGLAATVGGFLVVVRPKIGRVLLYSLIGIGILTVAGAVGVRQLRPDWLALIPQESSIQGTIYSLILIFAAGVQWLLLPRTPKAQPAPTSENKLHLNQFVANGPALRVQAAEARVLAAGANKGLTPIRPHRIPTRIQ